MGSYFCINASHLLNFDTDDVVSFDIRYFFLSSYRIVQFFFHVKKKKKKKITFYFWSVKHNKNNYNKN